MYDKEAPKLIKEHFPSVKLLVCLRNPIDRAYSHYWWNRDYFKVEERTFESAIKEEKEYVERGLYYKPPTRYLKYFDKTQIHFHFLEDIKQDPHTELAKAMKFLGIDSSKIMRLNEVNTAKGVKYSFVTGLMKQTSERLISLKMSYLLKMFYDDIHSLEVLLDKDLSHWK